MVHILSKMFFYASSVTQRWGWYFRRFAYLRLNLQFQVMFIVLIFKTGLEIMSLT